MMCFQNSPKKEELQLNMTSLLDLVMMVAQTNTRWLHCLVTVTKPLDASFSPLVMLSGEKQEKLFLSNLSGTRTQGLFMAPSIGKLRQKKGEMGLRILCFDIIHETFDTIIRPECNCFSDDIIKYEGSLCIYRCCADSWRNSLLVLTDYANRTWINQHTVDFMPIKTNEEFTNIEKSKGNEIQCIGVHKEKLIFWGSNSLVYYYSIVTSMFEKYTKLHARPISPGIVASYSESLISASIICSSEV